MYDEKIDGNAETRVPYVIKRSGERMAFNKMKIVKAITGANNDCGVESDRLDSEKIMAIADGIEHDAWRAGRDLSVEEIQDRVEDCLISAGKPKVAKAFILYRYRHAENRKMTDIDKRIESVIKRNNEEVNQENSNKNPTVLSTQRDYMAGEWDRYYVRNFILPDDIMRAHDEGIIHVHDTDYIAMSMNNCFSGDTKFVTDRGARSFRSFQDGEEVFVRDMYGALRVATVHCYGKQRMQEVILTAGKMRKSIVCTANHRWILSDGTVTTNLRVGDKLWMLPESETEPAIQSKEDAFAFCIGFIVGDGADCRKSTTSGPSTKIRLCGDKKKYAYIFQRAGFSIRSDAKSNDVFAYIVDTYKQDFLNARAWRYMSVHQKINCFKGYYSADGAVGTNRASTSDSRVCEFIEDLADISGWYITSKATVIHNTNFKQNAVLHTYHFMKHNVWNLRWTVKEIRNSRNRVQKAYCVEEPVTHSFTLAGGVVTGNCCLINLKDMLENGTAISGTHIDPPKSFATACTVMSQISAAVASSQYGGQTMSLAHLAPFVDVSRKKLRKRFAAELPMLTKEQLDSFVEKEVIKEVEAGCQTIQYQEITLSSTNGQAPFITLFMYLDEVPEGQTRDDLALIIKVMLEQRMKGVKDRTGHYVTPAFPKLIYALDEDNIHENSKYYYLTKLAAECTAKRMVPDYISAKIMRELKGDVYCCMGCRSFLTPDNPSQPEGNCNAGNIAHAGDYFPGQHKYYGRFNQGVVTINLVDVACSAVQEAERNGTDKFDTFWKIFDERLELCHKALQIRHNTLLGTPSDVAPILWQDGALARLKPGETIDKLLYGNYSTISLGYAGLYEACVEMTGKSHTDPAVQPFALKVMQVMNDKCTAWRKAENISYSLYGTPLESTTYKFAKCLQRRFGKIKDVTDHNYITNSYHVNVREPINAFDKLTLEAEFQQLSPGGAVSYVEVPNMQNNIQAVLALMKHIYNTIMYAELNTKSDYCDKCGYDGEIQIVKDDTGKLIWRCPNCGCTDQRFLHVARRTCGYIGTQFWNQGRTEEIAERVLHL